MSFIGRKYKSQKYVLKILDCISKRMQLHGEAKRVQGHAKERQAAWYDVTSQMWYSIILGAITITASTQIKIGRL